MTYLSEFGCGTFTLFPPNWPLNSKWMESKKEGNFPKLYILEMDFKGPAKKDIDIHAFPLKILFLASYLSSGTRPSFRE